MLKFEIVYFLEKWVVILYILTTFYLMLQNLFSVYFNIWLGSALNLILNNNVPQRNKVPPVVDACSPQWKLLARMKAFKECLQFEK